MTNSQGYIESFIADSWDGGDVWGSLLDAGFAIADVLYLLGEEVPSELDYTPSPLGADISDSLMATEMMWAVKQGHATVEELQNVGRSIAQQLDEVPEEDRY